MKGGPGDPSLLQGVHEQRVAEYTHVSDVEEQVEKVVGSELGHAGSSAVQDAGGPAMVHVPLHTPTVLQSGRGPSPHVQRPPSPTGVAQALPFGGGLPGQGTLAAPPPAPPPLPVGSPPAAPPLPLPMPPDPRPPLAAPPTPMRPPAPPVEPDTPPVAAP